MDIKIYVKNHTQLLTSAKYYSQYIKAYFKNNIKSLEVIVDNANNCYTINMHALIEKKIITDKLNQVMKQDYSIANFTFSNDKLEIDAEEVLLGIANY